MKLLLDTHIALWALSDDRQLRPWMRQGMTDADALYVSAVSIWEIAVKRALGKLGAPDDIADLILRTGVLPLSVSWVHGAAAGALPPHHADPFDRLLVAQAQIEGLTMLSADRMMRRYDVALLRGPSGPSE